MPWSAGLCAVGHRIAAVLRDGGGFALLFGRRRAAAAGSAPLTLPRFQALRSALFRCGLWVDGHLLRMRAPCRGGTITLPLGGLLPCADDAVLTGTRIERAYLARLDGLRTQLRGSGGAVSICAGSSMVPTFGPGDRLTFEACPRPRAGEIALIAGSTSLLAHRVVLAVGRGDAGWIVHRGDAEGSVPGIAAAWRVIGRLASVNRPAPAFADSSAGDGG